ncbi:PepSY domain-containing protein [Novosphingobium sp. PY1]|jgi:uncharacterized iron-regulated membrane protein|uniref:PepSY-associated TM helix domain-containing protein n=1 Tax=Novosphingobium sp. PY1 TaxID=1882221 RepID=UPI001A8E3CF3|nr:PepSY-associated TM helix domain-containing protein [Novosphingobium sp. PY1]GFM28785.1 uncharacterized protein PY1_contig-06-25 [Novosphingobium sp. PY1]
MKPGTFLRIHRWIALAFAPLLLIQALTGTMILFREPLAQTLDPGAMTRQSSHDMQPAPLSQILEAAGARFPTMRVTRLFMPSGPDAAAFAQLTGAQGEVRYASIDPGNARVLAAGPIWRFPIEAALQIHYRLLGDWLGIAIVTLNGLALFLIGVSGVKHWWPGRGRIVASLKVRRNLPSRIKLRLYHRSAGAIASILILFSATTGVLLAAADLPLGPAPASAAPARTITLSSGQVDNAISLLHARLPEARMRDIRIGLDGTLAINLLAPEAGPRAVDVVQIDATGPSLDKVLKSDDNPALWLTVLPLHAGDSFGLPGRLLLMAEALALIFLCISGPLQWWRARSSRPGAKK